MESQTKNTNGINTYMKTGVDFMFTQIHSKKVF